MERCKEVSRFKENIAIRGLGNDRSVSRNDRFHSRPVNLNRGTNYVMARRQCCCGHARFRKAITMKDAKTLLLEFLAAVTHRENAAALFAEDGAVDRRK